MVFTDAFLNGRRANRDSGVPKQPWETESRPKCSDLLVNLSSMPPCGSLCGMDQCHQYLQLRLHQMNSKGTPRTRCHESGHPLCRQQPAWSSTRRRPSTAALRWNDDITAKRHHHCQGKAVFLFEFCTINHHDVSTCVLAGFLLFMIYTRVRCVDVARLSEEPALEPANNGHGFLEVTASSVGQEPALKTCGRAMGRLVARCQEATWKTRDSGQPRASKTKWYARCPCHPNR